MCAIGRPGTFLRPEVCTVDGVVEAEPMCAICGSLTKDGLFPPGGAYHMDGPEGWVPLCHDHKAAFLRGQLPFPCWCAECRRWRSADHRHLHEKPRPQRSRS